MHPIGVGFIDLNAEGRFHFERLHLRPEFRCVAGWNAASDLAAVSHGRLPENADSPLAVIDDPHVSLVWIGPAAPAALITAALTAGKHVLMGLPVGISSPDWRYWTHHGTRICVAALHRWDGAFQMAKSVVDADGLGDLIDVRRHSRQYVPVELEFRRAADGTLIEDLAARQNELRIVRLKWFEILDELLLLVSDPVSAVTARPIGIRRHAGLETIHPHSRVVRPRLSSEPGMGDLSNHARGIAVWVEFANGCQAGLELERRSLAPLETGWILNGTRAGFSQGQRFQPGADHELVDVPVEELPTDQNAFYDALVETIQHGANFPVTPDSMLRVLEVLAMTEAS